MQMINYSITKPMEKKFNTISLPLKFAIEAKTMLMIFDLTSLVNTSISSFFLNLTFIFHLAS
jgi:hypothetical protein